MNKAKAILASYVGVLVYAGLVFLGAGTFAYWQGVLYVVLAMIGTTVSHVLTPAGSDITANRAKEVAAGQAWDKRLLAASFFINIGTFVVAGMDSGRYGWSGRVPVAVTVAGAILMLAGQALFALAKRENAFFSSTVRIQTERGHRLCDTGPYRFVRHPGYLGMLLALLAFPLVMDSYWALGPAVLAAVVLVVRTALEDRFLMGNLPGYPAYAARTRWRLIPGVF